MKFYNEEKDIKGVRQFIGEQIKITDNSYVYYTSNKDTVHKTPHIGCNDSFILPFPIPTLEENKSILEPSMTVKEVNAYVEGMFKVSGPFAYDTYLDLLALYRNANEVLDSMICPIISKIDKFIGEDIVGYKKIFTDYNGDRYGLNKITGYRYMLKLFNDTRHPETLIDMIIDNNKVKIISQKISIFRLDEILELEYYMMGVKNNGYGDGPTQ
jgi:hypothetical protein